MKLSKESYWIKSGFYTLMDKACTMLFGFGSFFFLIRLFSKEDFGAWTLFMSTTTLLEMARNGLVQNAMIKFLASGRDHEHPKIITASLVLNAMFTLAGMLLLISFSGGLSLLWQVPELQVMLYYYTFTAVILIPFSHFNILQQANLEFKGIFFSNLVRFGPFFLLILAFFLTNTNLTLYHLVKFQILTTATGAVVGYFFTRKYLVFSKSIDFKWIKKLFNYGKFVFGTNISSIMNKSIDQMFLGAMVSTASVAIYNTAVRITNLVEIPTAPMSSIVFPKSARRIETGGKKAVKYLYEKSVGIILALIVPCVAMVLLFPEFIIRVVAGENYLDAVPVLQVTILYMLFIPFARQFGTVLDSIGKPQINFYFVALGVLLNVMFNYIFIRLAGIIGAAYGTLVSHFICFFLYQVVVAKTLNVRTFNTLLHARDFYISGFIFTRAYLKKLSFKPQ